MRPQAPAGLSWIDQHPGGLVRFHHAACRLRGLGPHLCDDGLLAGGLRLHGDLVDDVVVHAGIGLLDRTDAPDD